MNKKISKHLDDEYIGLIADILNYHLEIVNIMNDINYTQKKAITIQLLLSFFNLVNCYHKNKQDYTLFTIQLQKTKKLFHNFLKFL